MFHARHEGECGTCHGHIEPGDLVTYDGDQVVHASEGTTPRSQIRMPDYFAEYRDMPEND